MNEEKPWYRRATGTTAYVDHYSEVDRQIPRLVVRTTTRRSVSFDTEPIPKSFLDATKHNKNHGDGEGCLLCQCLYGR
jgi:hypothetical protein